MDICVIHRLRHFFAKDSKRSIVAARTPIKAGVGDREIGIPLHLQSSADPSRAAMLFGKVSRYITGRGAVQTVYWRTSRDGRAKMVKTGRVISFRDKNGDKMEQKDVMRRDEQKARVEDRGGIAT